MKITNKISFLFAFLLTVLSVNTLIGLTQLMRIGLELKNVVLFERVRRAAEEIGFEGLPAARKEYLLDHIRSTQKGLETLGNSGRENIARGFAIIDQSARENQPRRESGKLKRAGTLLTKIDGILKD